MNIDTVLGRRRKPHPKAALARHRRKCNICNHIDRTSIEEDFLRWRSPDDIVRDYGLARRNALYRHAEATGLSVKRNHNLRSALDILIEQAESVPVTAAVIVRAVRAYTCLTDDGRWVEPPRRIIVERRNQPSPAPQPQLAPRAPAPHPEAQSPASLIGTKGLENAATR